MSSIFPLRETVGLDDGREPRLVDLDDDVADDVFKALSSGTTRDIFASLHESPQTASDLADVTDTSVQNTQYHLKKLVEADLIEVVDTWYSERGTEMKVYAPTDESLVLYAGNDKRNSLRAVLKRIVGVVALLLPASAVVAWLARQLAARPASTPETEGAKGLAARSNATATPGDGGGIGIMTDGGDGAANATPVETAVETATPTETASGVVDAIGGLDPAIAVGAAFFLGGVVVLGGVVLWSR
jgi:DNA-binding transcriptional ArsR family regulator